MRSWNRTTHEIFAKITKFQSKYYNFKQGLISRLSQQLTLCFVQLKCRLRKFGYSVQPKNIKKVAIFDLYLEYFSCKTNIWYIVLEFIIDNNGIFFVLSVTSTFLINFDFESFFQQCGNYRKILLHFFDKKFCESNVFTEEVTKELFSRKYFFRESKFLVFPHCGKFVFSLESFCVLGKVCF